MSSTNRGSVRNPHDYYYTPINTIITFWKKFSEVENVNVTDFSTILDPCAGGDDERPCAYPYALNMFDVEPDKIINNRFCTIDIREDSNAIYKEDYLNKNLGNYPLIISNPPFLLFEQFVKKGLTELNENGYLIFLLRLNAAGGQKRRMEFWNHYKPKSIYVHSRRPSFCKEATDSNEYAHYVWQKGYEGETNFYWA